MLTYSLDASEFSNLFDQFGRGDNFTLNARHTLFTCLDDLSDDIGDIEIDIIAICCEWSEYTVDELTESYSHMVDLDDDLDDGERFDEVLKAVKGNTTVVEVEQGSVNENTYLVMDF